jgi:hypothetical protein
MKYPSTPSSLAYLVVSSGSSVASLSTPVYYGFSRNSSVVHTLNKVYAHILIEMMN